jgi:hypothetical protein
MGGRSRGSAGGPREAPRNGAKMALKWCHAAGAAAARQKTPRIAPKRRQMAPNSRPTALCAKAAAASRREQALNGAEQPPSGAICANGRRETAANKR